MKVTGYISSFRTQDMDRDLEIKIQKEKIQDFCQKNNFQLLKIYEEPKDSRADYKPALMRLIRDASKKDFEKVIVLKLDKFSTEDLVKTWVAGELKKYKIEIHSLTESRTLKTSSETNTQKKVKNIRQKVRDIPSLPEIVTKVMELVQDPNSSAAQLSRVIVHDPGLTSRVLRLVNSAYYGFPKQISSIQHAIMILGFTTMRGLVLSSSIFKIFAPINDGLINLDYKKFWKHSLVAAISSKKINNYLHFQEDEDIFSSAILHDIGKIILDQYDHENYVKVLKEVPSQILSEIVLESEEKNCEVTHVEIGHMVAESWNLPESISDVIKYHHSPLSANENARMASIVYIGNILAHMILDNHNFDIRIFNQKVLDYLGLSEDDLLDINAGIIEEIENIGDLESFFK